MYTFSSKLKTFSFVLMILGVLGMGYGFFTAPKTTDDVKGMMHTGAETHEAAADTHNDAEHATAAMSSEEEQAHLEHALHQAQNRPWSAFFISAFFFLMISVTVLVFYAMQWAAQAGWSIVLYRVMEAITAYILPGSILLFVFLLASGLHFNHMYAWMSPEAAHDPILQEKSWWLNTSGWMIRGFVYLLAYNFFGWMLRKNSIALDESGDIKIYKRTFNYSVVFLVVFAIFELFMSFDWLMSLDPHWYSQLYSFYVFASMLVSGITVIAIVTIYLRSKGFLPFVNSSHVHDLAVYMFGFSIFWAYFFFDQFMLQWYANIPEESAYFFPRLLGSYQTLFIGMIILNFVFPFLILMDKDFKKTPWFVITAGVVLLIGHFIDIYQLISPATVGNHWSFGIPEIGSLFFFLGLFIFVIFNALTKASLHAKGNPFMKESEIYHYS